MDAVAILMVEDSPLDAELILGQLRRGGISHIAERVQTRETFEAELRKKAHHLILADFAMPQFDGMSALSLARAQAPEVPFIFVSGAIGEERAIQGLRAGATDYVLKDKLDRLPAAVTRALGEARERKRAAIAEAALRESQEQYRVLVESVHDFAIFMVDPQGRIKTWNSGANRVLGFTAAEVVGRSASVFFTPEDLAKGEFEKELSEAALKGKGDDDRWLVRRDGTRFWASGTVTPIHDARGGLAGFVKVLRDATERKRADEELRRSNTELEQFAYAASHDMREPLRTVTSYAQLLGKKFRGQLGSEGDQYLGFIEGGVKRMLLLLEDLLSYSRLLHDRQPEFRVVQLNAVVEEVKLMLETSIREKQATIERDTLPAIIGDQRQIAQLFQNLFSNALKYQTPGVEPVIRVSAGFNGGECTIAVSDNGIGFEQQYAERIFGLFRRLHGDAYPGTGIGLALCKRVVEHHGGRIWAKSELHNGATFYFTLPAVGEALI